MRGTGQWFARVMAAMRRFGRKAAVAARELGALAAGIWHRIPVRTKIVALLAVVVLVLSGISSSQALHDIRVLRGGDGQMTSQSRPAEGKRDIDISDGKGDNDVSRQSDGKAEPKPNDGTNKADGSSTANPEALWREATGGTQPDLSGMTDLSVEVDLAAQRVHVRSGGRDVYVMTVSTGVDDTTPHGDFTISGRGEHFYNPDEGMGGDLWVNFLDNVYLFHTVPTRQNAGDYIPEEGAKLGEPASHGCVRLSLADARWFYDQIPDGTPVHIG